MLKAITFQGYLPMRLKPSQSSEMILQILFELISWFNMQYIVRKKKVVPTNY